MHVLSFVEAISFKKIAMMEASRRSGRRTSKKDDHDMTAGRDRKESFFIDASDDGRRQMSCVYPSSVLPLSCTSNVSSRPPLPFHPVMLVSHPSEYQVCARCV